MTTETDTLCTQTEIHWTLNIFHGILSRFQTTGG